MEKVLSWLFDMFSFLINSALSWKILGDFSFLHLILGGIFLIAIFNLITFGYSNVGGTADYIGGIRRSKNIENKHDKEKFQAKTYTTTISRVDSRGRVSSSSYTRRTKRRE